MAKSLSPYPFLGHKLARENLRTALGIFRETADPALEAKALNNLAMVCVRIGDNIQATGIGSLSAVPGFSENDRRSTDGSQGAGKSGIVTAFQW